MRQRQLERLIGGARKQLDVAARAEKKGQHEAALEAYEHALFLIGVDPWGEKHIFAENGVDAEKIEERIRELKGATHSKGR